jgi:hypothetical protein
MFKVLVGWGLSLGALLVGLIALTLFATFWIGDELEWQVGVSFLIEALSAFAFAVIVNPITPKYIPQFGSQKIRRLSAGVSILVGFTTLGLALWWASTQYVPRTPKTDFEKLSLLRGYSTAHGVGIQSDDQGASLARCISNDDNSARFTKAIDADEDKAMEVFDIYDIFDFMEADALSTSINLDKDDREKIYAKQKQVALAIVTECRAKIGTMKSNQDAPAKDMPSTSASSEAAASQTGSKESPAVPHAENHLEAAPEHALNRPNTQAGPLANPVSPSGPNPSPACAEKTRRVDKLICLDPSLAALDVRLNDLYRRARTNAVNPGIVESDQDQWSREREACGNNNCLHDVYRRRIANLKLWAE